MKDTYYFSHDYNARSDVKIKRLIAKHGLLGYGIYWAIVEDLYQNANALPLDYESIAFDLRADASVIESVINDFELFIIEGAKFGSLSIERRLDVRADKSSKARESARIRWEKHANALRLQSERNAIKERKGKEKKEKEIKEVVEVKKEEPIEKHSLIVWIEKNTPRVQTMKEPISNQQAEKIVEDYKLKPEAVKETLLAMNNSNKLKNYISANSTLRNWIRLDEKRKENQSNLFNPPKITKIEWGNKR